MTTEPIVRIMTTSIAASDWGFQEGQIVVFPAGIPVPDVLRINSEPYTGALPHKPAIFDAAWFAKVNQPRVEPPPPVTLTEGDILKRFHWTREQFGLARGSCGFPDPFGRRLGPHGGSTGFWQEPSVDAWAAAIASLGVR